MNLFRSNPRISWMIVLSVLCMLFACTLQVDGRKSRRTRRFGPPSIPFDRNNFDSRYFLSALPSDSLLSQSYPIRENLASALQKSSSGSSSSSSASSSMSDRQMVTTEAEFHPTGSETSNGLIQFRQVSDMWLTEIKGVIQQLPPKSRLFLIVHESKEPVNADCSNLGSHLNPYHQPHGDPAALADVKTTKLSTHLGDLTLLSTDSHGNAIIKLQSLHVSLFNDTSSIIGHAIAVHEVTGNNSTNEKVVACANISSNVKVSPAKFQKSKKPKRSYF